MGLVWQRKQKQRQTFYNWLFALSSFSLHHLPPLPTHWLCHNRQGPKPCLSAVPPADCLSGKGPVTNPVTQLQLQFNPVPGTCDQDRVSLKFTLHP